MQTQAYVDGAEKLNDLTRALAALPAGATAKKRLAELLSNAEAKAQFEAAQKAKTAEEELAIAKRLQSDRKDEGAYLKFKTVAATFAGTSAGEQAKAAVAGYEKNPALGKKANDSGLGGEGQGR